MWEIGVAYDDKLRDKTCGGRPFLVFGLVIITNDLVGCVTPATLGETLNFLLWKFNGPIAISDNSFLLRCSNKIINRPELTDRFCYPIKLLYPARNLCTGRRNVTGFAYACPLFETWLFWPENCSRPHILFKLTEKSSTSKICEDEVMVCSKTQFSTNFVDAYKS
jgi:hypothetical protein